MRYSLHMTLTEILSLAKDYRGEYPRVKNPHTRDEISPHVFNKQYLPIDILANRLRFSHFTSFEFKGQMISNMTSDGLAIICDSHTYPDGGSSTWSNKLKDPLSYTQFFMNDCEIIRKGHEPHEWNRLHAKNDTFLNPQWFFILNPKIITIHHKILSDGNFELEILDARGIIGYFSD